MSDSTLPPPDPRDPGARSGLDRRMLVVGALALLALGLYVGLELVRAPAAPAVVVGGPPPAPPAVMGFDQFMGVFGLLGKDPGAVSFAQSFMQEPELAEEWKEFQKDKDVKTFVENLKESPSFQRVLRKSAAKPEFKPAVERALRLLPSLSGMLQSGASLRLVTGSLPGPAAAPAFAGAGSERSSRSDAGRAVRVGPGRRGPSFGQGFARTQTAAGTLGLAGSQGSAFSGAGDGRNVGAGVAAVDGRAGAQLSAAGPVSGLGRERDAHSTIPLPEVQDVGSERTRRLLELFPWLAGLTDQEREALLAPPLIEQHGLWGACFALRMYERCRAACAASGGKCTADVSGWRACLDFKNGDVAACFALCPQQPGCVPPAPVRASSGPNSSAGACGQCSGWTDGRCLPADQGCGFRSNRSCPPASGCNTSQAHQSTDPATCSDGTRRAPGACP